MLQSNLGGRSKVFKFLLKIVILSKWGTLDLKHIPSDKMVLDLISVAEMESGVLEFKGWDGGKAFHECCL